MTLSFARTFLQDYYRAIESGAEFDGTPEELAQAKRIVYAHLGGVLEEEEPHDFYCAEFYRCGYVCSEGQCDQCAKL